MFHFFDRVAANDPLWGSQCYQMDKWEGGIPYREHRGLGRNAKCVPLVRRYPHRSAALADRANSNGYYPSPPFASGEYKKLRCRQVTIYITHSNFKWSIGNLFIRPLVSGSSYCG